MSPFWTTLLLGLGFVASHLLLSHPPVRAPLVRKMGPWLFRGFYSVVSFAFFVPLILVFADHRHEGPMVFRIAWPGIVHVTELAVVLGFALVLGSLAKLPPSAMMYKGEPVVAGMNAITRHPVSMGVMLWAVGHMLVNPWAVDLAFYGSFVAVSVLGSLHQDHRLSAERDGYRAFMQATTHLPWPTPSRLRKVGVLPAVGAVVGVVIAVVLRMFHGVLFG